MSAASGEYLIPIRESAAAFEKTVVLEIFAQTDVGRTREHNEDALLVANLSTGEALQFGRTVLQPADPAGTLFLVADGMGGAAAGEVASATAVNIILDYLRKGVAGRMQVAADEIVRLMHGAAAEANRAIFEYAARRSDLRGMGTTATMAVLVGDTVYVGQIGDSRAYLVRQGHAYQLTRDQSLLQKLIEVGELSEADAALSERRNIILQALGPERQVQLDVTRQQVRRGDVLILCSDGLSNLVSPEEIAQAVDEELDLAAAVDRLVRTANARGGPDNISVIAVRFAGMSLEHPKASDPVGYQSYLQPAADLEGGEKSAAMAERALLLRRYSRTLAVATLLLIALLIWRILAHF
jgi:serine/threonine protein phosphatase PrpC